MTMVMIFIGSSTLSYGDQSTTPKAAQTEAARKRKERIKKQEQAIKEKLKLEKHHKGPDKMPPPPANPGT